MADLKIPVVTASTERAIRDRLMDLLSHVSKRYGIEILEIRAAWLDVSTVCKPEHILHAIEMRTQCRNWPVPETAGPEPAP